MDDVLTTSAEQMVLDHELIHRLRYIRRGTHVDADMLGLDVIQRCCTNGEFLGDEHTVRHLRSGDVWLPAVSNWVPYESWETDKEDLIGRAGRVVEDLLNAHPPTPWPADLDRAVRKIVEKELLVIPRSSCEVLPDSLRGSER